LWVAAVSLIIAFVVFYFIVRVFKNIAGIPAAIKRRKKLVCAQEYQHDIMHGVVELAKGELKNFKKSEKYFLNAAEIADKSKSVDKNNRYANYLLAAKAAHWSRDYHSRDRYLKTALTINPEARFDIELSQAQFYLDSDQVDDALIILKRLYQQEPKNYLLLKSLKLIYIKTHDVQSLKVLLPQLKKQDLLTEQEIAGLNIRV